tara:strand:- start:40 stop:615 length:576 start_codon:yes stop_codon:yes gene_type:complete
MLGLGNSLSSASGVLDPFIARFSSNSFTTTNPWSASSSYATLTAGESYTIGETTYTNLLKLKQNDESEAVLHFFDSNFWTDTSLTTAAPGTSVSSNQTADFKFTIEYIFPSSNDVTNKLLRLISGSTSQQININDIGAEDTLLKTEFSGTKTANGVFFGIYFNAENTGFVSPGDTVYIRSIKIEVNPETIA